MRPSLAATEIVISPPSPGRFCSFFFTRHLRDPDAPPGSKFEDQRTKTRREPSQTPPPQPKHQEPMCIRSTRRNSRRSAPWDKPSTLIERVFALRSFSTNFYRKRSSGSKVRSLPTPPSTTTAAAVIQISFFFWESAEWGPLTGSASLGVPDWTV